MLQVLHSPEQLAAWSKSCKFAPQLPRYEWTPKECRVPGSCEGALFDCGAAVMSWGAGTVVLAVAAHSRPLQPVMMTLQVAFLHSFSYFEGVSHNALRQRVSHTLFHVLGGLLLTWLSSLWTPPCIPDKHSLSHSPLYWARPPIPRSAPTRMNTVPKQPAAPSTHSRRGYGRSATQAVLRPRHVRRPRTHVQPLASVAAPPTAWPPLVLSTVEEQHIAPPQPELGYRVDFNETYVKGKLLGQGSFGTVHQGINTESGLEVAIKTLPKVRGKLTREKTLEKIWREVDMLTRLQRCKGAVRLLGCFEDANHVMLVMELCTGGDLQQYVDTFGPLDEPALASVAFEIIKIVQSCHELGILHGDIKPANIMCNVKSASHAKSVPTNLRAIDFGCSQFLGPRRLTKRTGTPIFMAPEIFRRSYSDPVDTWAIGVTLYWLFSKKFPFFDDAEVVKQAKLEAVEFAVTNVPIPYDFAPWTYMSAEGLSFMQSCLVRDEELRASTEDLLQHPWLRRYIAAEELAHALEGGCTIA